MFNLCLAGHTFAVYNQCDYVKNLCRDYRVSTPGDVVIAASDEEIFAEGSRRNGKGYLESLAVYRKI